MRTLVIAACWTMTMVSTGIGGGQAERGPEYYGQKGSKAFLLPSDHTEEYNERSRRHALTETQSQESDSKQLKMGLLDVKQDAYGPGVGIDQYGRPVKLVPAHSGHQIAPGEQLKVEPDAYGPGVGMDQYGRPVKFAPAW